MDTKFCRDCGECTDQSLTSRRNRASQGRAVRSTAGRTLVGGSLRSREARSDGPPRQRQPPAVAVIPTGYKWCPDCATGQAARRRSSGRRQRSRLVAPTASRATTRAVRRVAGQAGRHRGRTTSSGATGSPRRRPTRCWPRRAGCARSAGPHRRRTSTTTTPPARSASSALLQLQRRSRSVPGRPGRAACRRRLRRSTTPASQHLRGASPRGCGPRHAVRDHPAGATPPVGSRPTPGRRARTSPRITGRTQLGHAGRRTAGEADG